MLLVIGLNTTQTHAADNSYLLWTMGTPCGGDSITETSLNNAFSAIENGVLNVPLSQNGCIRYIQELSGNTVTNEWVTLAGQNMIVWTHTDTLSSGQEDENLDGFFENRTMIDRTPNQEKIEFVTYSKSPQMIIERITCVPNGDMLHVIWEKYLDETGELTIIGEKDIPNEQGEMGLGSPIGNNASTSSLSVAKDSGVCTLDQLVQLEDLFMEALQKGNECMANYKRSDFGLSAIQKVLPSRHPHQWQCKIFATPEEDNPTDIAIFQNWRYWFQDTIMIKINQNPDPACPSCNFWGLSHEQQLNVIFHELLHAKIPAHFMSLQTNNVLQFDQVYACAGLCFPRAGTTDLNKCSCATCLKTNLCDTRCSKKAECTSPILSVCPCPLSSCCAFKYYAEPPYLCDVECPRGLACFAFQCKHIYNLNCK